MSTPAFETAAHLCKANVLSVTDDEPVESIREKLAAGTHYDVLDYIYVLDSYRVLTGLITLKQLFVADATSTAESIAEREVISVSSQADQEQVALLSLEHSLKSVPVIDDEGRLLGVIPSHIILQILHDEHVEDTLKEAGVDHGALRVQAGLFYQLKSRLPWLLYGTIGGLLAAGIVHSFEDALAERILLAAFIPTIVYLADAVGNQVQTLYIRAYAFGLSDALKTSLWREAKVAFIVGLVISAFLAAVIFLWFQETAVAAIVASAAAVSILFAGIIAVLMPWLFMRLGYDPAVSSGPLGTIILDISSIIIYFLVAETLLRYLA